MIPGLPWAIPAALLAAWVVHVLRNYEIRAFSDPLNWLHFARHFGTEIHISKFALGFPVFLRTVLELAGPCHVFLVNLPVLIATYLLGAALAFRAFEPVNILLLTGIFRRPWAEVTILYVFQISVLDTFSTPAHPGRTRWLPVTLPRRPRR